MSGPPPAPDWIVSRPVAHRGYHDLNEGRAENSLSAFAAAIAEGFAIECDLQMSQTGEPVVFHDPTLKRMTGLAGKVREHTPEQLGQMRLAGTKDGIYTLSRHLELVAGQVPLVLELKGVKGADAGFVEGVAQALADYDGPVCIMSFDHWICARFKPLLPSVPRGLTAQGNNFMNRKHQQAMKDYDLQFVSYCVGNLPNKFVQASREAGLPVITWTVRTERERALTFDYADQMTFEGFNPNSQSDER